jgi:peptide/nickel transport system permease protein
MFKDIIPNLMPFVLVKFVHAARYVIFQAVGLYFIGILPSSTSNWGILLNQAVNQYGALFSLSGAYLVFIPTLAILLLTLGLILLAQGTDRIFNPRVRTRLAGESESTEDGDAEPVVTGGI